MISPIFLHKVALIPGHPNPNRGTSRPFPAKDTGNGALHKIFVRDIPGPGSLMSNEYPAQKLNLWAVFPS